MIRLELVNDDIEPEVDRLANGLSATDKLRFETVLARQFSATQQAVHVITRSLKTSGRFGSKADIDSWEGEITYGGPSIGSVHNPVVYAEFEREREGGHDFLDPADALNPEYIKAIKAFLEG